ncbi:hypothetical protein PEC18_00340 [Paucibacter sp. O1-1]|nr:hypothetical protein [Paucibacter sp. O1-1]MDA3824363.1 hypothetical protein [Paucibacter sp. O1-1]
MNHTDDLGIYFVDHFINIAQAYACNVAVFQYTGFGYVNSDSNPFTPDCLRAGTSRQPIRVIKPTPAAATASPTGRKSNMAKLPVPV